VSFEERIKSAPSAIGYETDTEDKVSVCVKGEKNEEGDVLCRL